MHLHILGICGTFMGGIAALARAAGHRVTGCDANVYPPMSTQLTALGIELIEGFDPKQCDLQPDVFVIGNVVKRGNPLMEAILNQGLPYISGPQWLADHVLQGKWVLAVAGTHGKTTTASILAWILEYAGLAPGFLIGGIPENFGISARLPGIPPADLNSTSPFFVIEADEYDTAFFDKRSKFVHYHPRTAILNNLEFDHADIFPNVEAIETQFHHLIRTVPGQGRLIVNATAPHLQKTLEKGVWTPVEPFLSEAGWNSVPVEKEGETHFEVVFEGHRYGELVWDLYGEHNRANALAAIAAARHVGVPPGVALEALASFQNVKRRMEKRGVEGGVTVYDDFAHHPTAIQTTLEGLAAVWTSGRILAVLEPRSNTMKLGTLSARLASSLKAADHTFCYAGGIDWAVEDALYELGHQVEIEREFSVLIQKIVEKAEAGDAIVVMSNGGFGGIHTRLLDGLKKKGIH